jgi:phosphotransferase system HPr-like phosphotransfer protein
VEMDVAGKKIHVREPGFRADGRSPIDMVALVAPLGTTLRVICDGEDAEEAIKAITGLFELDLDAGHEFLG